MLTSIPIVEIQNIIKQVENELKLELNNECDGRYTWPERWKKLKLLIERANKYNSVDV